MIQLQAERKLFANGRFRGFQIEPERQVRRFTPKDDPKLETLRSIWHSFTLPDMALGSTMYFKASESLLFIDSDAKTIEKFSIALAEFQGEKEFSWKAGFFLSALMNGSSSDDFIVHTRHISEDIHCIGFNNRKRMIIDGDIGSGVGSQMEKGKIVVQGNAGWFAGSKMHGGLLEIEGNVLVNAAREMKGGLLIVHGNTPNGDCGFANNSTGGLIIIKGNISDKAAYSKSGGILMICGDAGHELGSQMTCGEIIVKGEAEGVGALEGGRIYLAPGSKTSIYPSGGIVYSGSTLVYGSADERAKEWVKRKLGLIHDPEQRISKILQSYGYPPKVEDI
jgi:hypothetical protein